MNFLNDLEIAISEWKKDSIEDEWAFEQFRSKTIPLLSTSETFELIGAVLELLVNEDDDDTALELLQTVLTMARHSQTTEMPPNLIENMALLKSRFDSMGDYERQKMGELLRYYRV